jgi:hypothetical protein
MIVFLLPNLSMVRPPINEPKTAPPENVLLIAPMIGVPLEVSKKDRKSSDAMTSVMTPESYPKRNELDHGFHVSMFVS